MKKIIATFVFSLFVFSCTTSTITSFDQVQKVILENQWLLQDENGTVLSFNNSPVDLSFSKDDQLKAHGFSGCNRFFTNATLTAEKIQFGQMGATMMACPEMETEQTYLSLLAMVDNYEVSGKELKLFQGKVLLLRFLAK